MTETSSLAPEHVGVLGGGRMGAGIAHAFLLAGSRVTVVERDADAAQAAAARVLESVDSSIARGTALAPVEEYRERLATGTDAALFAPCPLVVEAVPEDLALKIDALRRVEAHVASDAVIASNTSSISIDELAAVLDRPSHLLGMHFFNPVPASTLVEIVRGASTAPRSSIPPAAGSPPSARRRSSSPMLPASRRPGSVSRSGSRRSACSRRASPPPKTSTRR